MTSRILSLREAATIACRSAEAVKKWCQSGKLTARKAQLPSGRSEWVVKLSDLKKFLDEKKG